MTTSPSKLKKTPWFPADVLPVHFGVYEMEKAGASKLYRLFDANGTTWRYGSDTIAFAASFRSRTLPVPKKHYRRWRGLAAKP